MDWTHGRESMHPIYMAEDALLKFAQPMLIGIGLIVVLTSGTLLQLLWSSWTSRDSKLEKLEALIIRQTFEIEKLQNDVNNLGKVVRGIRGERPSS